jgi:hypothetical protein
MALTATGTLASVATPLSAVAETARTDGRCATTTGEAANCPNKETVTRAFDVEAGPIAPAFQQPGGGRQYLLMSAYVPGAPTPLNVKWLIDSGYLNIVY